MKSSEELYLLIKSLNKAEKGFFKKYSLRHVKAESSYLRLFNFIDKNCSNIVDENKIKRHFKNERFINNFSVVKAYLYDSILKCLSIFYSSGKETKIKADVRNIEILYDRTLYKSAFKLLKKVKEKAYSADAFLQLLELIKLEKNLIHEGALPGAAIRNLEHAYEEEKEILLKLNNINEYRMLSYRVHDIIRSSAEIDNSTKEILQNLTSSELLRKPSAALSYPALINYYHILSVIYSATGDMEANLYCREKTIELMESEQAKLTANPQNYLIALYNYMSTCLRLNKEGEFITTLQKIRSIPQKFSKNISDNVKLLLFIGPAIEEMKFYRQRGDISRAVSAAQEAEKGIDLYKGRLAKTDELTCSLEICCVYLQAGNLNKALEWNNKILNEKENIVISTIQDSSRLLNLIIHYELGNAELLEYRIKSTYRHFKRKQKKDIRSDMVINLLKKIPSLKSQKEIIEYFKETKYRLEKLKAENPDSHFFSEFNFIEYLDKKIKSGAA